MGLLDRFKKKDDELGDLSDLGDFGLDDKSSSPGSNTGDLSGPLPSLDSHDDTAGLDAAAHREEVHPTSMSQDMGDQLGLKPADPLQSHGLSPTQPGPAPVHQAPQQPQYASQYGSPDIRDLGKEIEIVHAKLDSIKSTLDSINQRLATLERIASPDTKNRYQW